MTNRQALELLDNLAAKSIGDREIHIKYQQALQIFANLIIEQERFNSKESITTS